MNQREQFKFVHDLVDATMHKVLMEINEGKYPETWDGVELRWLLAERFDAFWVMKEARKRKREFKNYVLVNNL
jgi:hypothetical protein